MAPPAAEQEAHLPSTAWRVFSYVPDQLGQFHVFSTTWASRWLMGGCSPGLLCTGAPHASRCAAASAPDALPCLGNPTWSSGFNSCCCSAVAVGVWEDVGHFSLWTWSGVCGTSQGTLFRDAATYRCSTGLPLDERMICVNLEPSSAFSALACSFWK